MILITGGTGFLGRFIVDELLRHGEQVRILARNPDKVAPREGVDIVKGDLLDHAELDQAMEGVDRVIHAAAVVSFWSPRHEEMKEVNVKGTELLVDVCLQHGIDKLLHVSSVAAMGRTAAGGMVDETSKWSKSKLNTRYGRTKYLAELEIYRGIEEGLNAVICNPGLILGPGTPDPDGWNQGTPKLFKTIYKGLRFYNPGSAGVVAATDVAKGIYQLLQSDFKQGERFLMVAENLDFKTMFDWMAEALGVKGPQTAPPRWAVMLAARLMNFWSKITKKEPLITPETARVSRHKSSYDASKITRSIDFQYADMKTVIQDTAQQFLKDHAAKGKR